MCETPGLRSSLRCSLDIDKVVEIDGIPYPLAGSEAVRKNLVKFIMELINAQGGPVGAADFDLRSRDIEKQLPAVKSLIGSDAKSGSGHRIPLEKLYKNPRLS